MEEEWGRKNSKTNVACKPKGKRNLGRPLKRWHRANRSHGLIPGRVMMTVTTMTTMMLSVS
jgi:hypothetical protein